MKDLTPGTKNPATVHDNSGMPAKYFTQVLLIEDIGSKHELVVRTFDQAPFLLLQMLPSPANATFSCKCYAAVLFALVHMNSNL